MKPLAALALVSASALALISASAFVAPAIAGDACSTMEAFIEHARLVLPILGCDLFRTRSSVPRTADPAGGDNPTFVFSTAGARATARETEDGFVVLAGSTARRHPSNTFPAGNSALRDKLIAEGQLVDGPSAELLRFAADVVFTSPSAAASIVAARSASGPLEWKIGETSTTYRDWRAKKLDTAPAD